MLLDLPELVYILVKFVDDIDVGQFLLNIEPTLINRNAGETFNTETDMMASYPNKCIFLNCLFYWSDYLRVEDNERELLLAHLNALMNCFNSYFFDAESEAHKQAKRKNMPLWNCNNDYDFKITENALGIEWSTGVKTSCEDFFEADFLPEKNQIKSIFKFIINSYKQYKFYYRFCDNEKLFKVTIENMGNKISTIEKEYKIYTDRTSYIIDDKTGLKCSFNKKLDCWAMPVGYKSFKRLHEKTIEILSGNLLKPCTWCNPENTTKRTEKCDNCAKLSHFIDMFIEKRTAITKQKINAVIKQYQLSSCKNLAELRLKRKLALKEFFNNKIYDNRQKNEFNKLLNTAFSDIE